MRRLALSLACLTLLTACETASGPPLGPSVRSVEAGRYTVTYRGTSRMSQPEVQDRALVQAAQVTLNNGGDWFSVAGRSGGVAPPTGPQFSFGIGGASFGRNSAVGADVGTTVGGEATFVASLEILIGHGPKPSEPNAYDARDVISTVGARLH